MTRKHIVPAWALLLAAVLSFAASASANGVTYTVKQLH
jgi:hypothetical protein